MKKVLKLVVAIILALAILGTVMFLVDCSRGKSGKEPIFAIIKTYDNGGHTYYMGLGYSIIDDMFTGDITAKIGPWNIYLQKGNELIIDSEHIDDNKEENSGYTEILSNPSGESISGDIIGIDLLSGDNQNINNDILSGEQEKEQDEKGYYFNATIIGVNGNSIVVQALEGEEITKSSDMFSFSLEEETVEYLIGQKVRIKYTGTIRESYPAQIDVIDIKIIE